MAEQTPHRDHTQNPNRLATEREKSVVDVVLKTLMESFEPNDGKSPVAVFDDLREAGTANYLFYSTLTAWQRDFISPMIPYTAAEIVHIGPPETVPGVDLTVSRKMTWGLILGGELEQLPELLRGSRASTSYDVFDADGIWQPSPPACRTPEKALEDAFESMAFPEQPTLGQVQVMVRGLQLLGQAAEYLD